LRDTHYSGAEKLGHGKGYKYPHNFKGHFVKQEYLEKKREYYQPTDSGYEKVIKERLKKQRNS